MTAFQRSGRPWATEVGAFNAALLANGDTLTWVIDLDGIASDGMLCEQDAIGDTRLQRLLAELRSL